MERGIRILVESSASGQFLYYLIALASRQLFYPGARDLVKYGTSIGRWFGLGGQQLHVILTAVEPEI